MVRVCERPFMLCFMFAALVFNRLRAENCDDGGGADDDDERRNVEMMLIKISVIFYDYFYYTFFAFCARMRRRAVYQ